MKLFLLSALICFVIGSSAAQELQEQSVITAKRVDHPPKMDGVLDDAVWSGAEIVTNFIQNEPNPGEPSRQNTEVRILYDNTAIYIGATLYDIAADSILRQLSNRDREENTDIFGVFLDTYDDDINGYGFVVHPTGVQWDARYSANGHQEVSWDAVWESKVTIDETNWYVEMRIPYSAIRFSKDKEQVWGINFGRKIRRYREFSWWSHIDPEVDGFVNQWGALQGIVDIQSPVRISVLPYVSMFYENVNDKPNKKISEGYALNGGMDLKYGLNDAFTLDMTLVPDFGQVQSDNQVLNLSPFEVKFQERRPFFMEGTELFNKGGLFYSRRIGATPTGFYNVASLMNDGDTLLVNPSSIQLINSTKISGRTPAGLGVGVLNAITARTFATVEDGEGVERLIETEPLVNYNVFVLDRTLKNNSFISFVNTNVFREGRAYDANVSGAQFKFANNKNTYAVNGSGSVSQLYYSGTQDDEFGYKYFVRAGKISGQWQYGIWQNVESDTYNPNDLGFLFNNNEISTGASLDYRIFEPFWKLVRSSSSLNIYYSRLYRPNTFNSFSINLNTTATFKSYISAGLWASFAPVETYDYFEARVAGRYYLNPSSTNYGAWFSSDYRKKFALDGSANFRQYSDQGRTRFNYSLSPRVRINDHLSFNYNCSINDFKDDVGYVAPDSSAIVFGRRDLYTMTNRLTAKYIFTNRMGVSFRLRHYWSQADYTSYHELLEDGYLRNEDYSSIDLDGEDSRDVNFNAFNIDMVYTWVFAPGSELNIVWKNSILNRGTGIQHNYFKNFEDVLDLAQTNSLSIKFLYYLDYLSLRKK